MHGRVKVRTTAEQEAAKRKEREQKRIAYLKLRDGIFAKMKRGDHDDEALALTAAMLSNNPDFATLFNYRRNTLLALFETDPDDDARQARCDAELEFTATCLRSNAKSYAAWHQRRWVMTKAPQPPWTNERALCHKLLLLDERNFHCWDYMRWVIDTAPAEAHVTDVDAELAFAHNKIEENLSNYSAWHYRSQLLARRHNLPSQDLPQAVFDEERDTVTHAINVDPMDQSAWFYHRWLLGRREAAPCVLRVGVAGGRLFLVFNQNVQLDEDKITVLADDGTVVGGAWGRPGPADSQVAALWYFSSPDMEDPSRIRVEAAEGAFSTAGGLAGAAWTGSTSFTQELPKVLGRWQSAQPALLEHEREELAAFLEELEEEETKWTRLALVDILWALGVAQHAADLGVHLARLCELDETRKGYYKSMQGRLTCEARALELPIDATSLSLADHNLGRLDHAQCFAHLRSVNLSGNVLRSLRGLDALVAVEELDLSSNAIEEVDLAVVTDLGCLKVLNLAHNRITRVAAITTGPVEAGRALPTSSWTGNPVAEDAAAWTELVRLWPYATK